MIAGVAQDDDECTKTFLQKIEGSNADNIKFFCGSFGHLHRCGCHDKYRKRRIRSRHSRCVPSRIMRNGHASARRPTAFWQGIPEFFGAKRSEWLSAWILRRPHEPREPLEPKQRRARPLVWLSFARTCSIWRLTSVGGHSRRFDCMTLTSGLLYSAVWGQALSDYPPLQCRCRSRARASLRNRHQGPSIMGFEDEAEQSLPRPCRQCYGRSNRKYELTSSIVPRGTSFHRKVEFEFPPIGSDLSRCHAAAAACSRVHRNSVPSIHIRCMITANRRASATIAFFIPQRLAICMAQALSQDHFFECIVL